MSYGIDLSPRQTARTLEQAVRHQAPLQIHPRIDFTPEPVPCRLQRIDSPSRTRVGRGCLIVEVESSNEPAPDATPDWAQLIATYVDVELWLGDDRYMFCADVVTVAQAHGATQISLARPEVIQVAQRRRFWRFRPAQSAHVDLRWPGEDGTEQQAIGAMCNVSGDGLACRIDARTAEQLGIGDAVRTAFALAPGDPQRFTLDAELCSKTPGGTEGTIIIGLHFKTDAEHASSAAAAATLREQLVARYSPPADVPKGADA